MVDELQAKTHPVEGVSIKDSQPEDPSLLAPNLRIEDIRECMRASDMGPEEALDKGLQYSHRCKTIWLYDKPIAMFGVVPGGDQGGMVMGYVWMLAARDLERYAKTLMRFAPLWVEDLSEGYDIVGNYVDEDNEVHVRWLERMGFKIVDRHKEFGPYRKPFLEFVKLV